MKIYFILVLAVVFILSSTPLQAQIEPHFFVQSVPARTILLGTYIWDIETDSFPVTRNYNNLTKSDIWWQQINRTRQQLVPRNCAAFAIVREKQFEELTLEDLQNLRYSFKPVSNEHLQIGAVVAMRTAEGNFAKLRVNGYRALHDFSFKEAEILRESWKAFVLGHENRENYHLELEWVLFKKQDQPSGNIAIF